MDSSPRSPESHASDFDEDEGSTTAIFQQKMSDIFSSLAPGAPHTTQADADIASLLGDTLPPDLAPTASDPVAPVAEAPLATISAPVPSIPSGPSSSRAAAPLPTAAPGAARSAVTWIALVLGLLALLAAGAFVVLRPR